MKVSYTLRAWEGEEERPMKENELTGQGADLAQKIRARDSYGYVTLQQEGAPEVVLEDELEALIAGLCVDVIPDLAAGRPASVRFYVYFGGVDLVPEGDGIRLIREGVELGRYLKAELLEALVACGERYLDFQRRLYCDQDTPQEYYAELEAEVTKARAALEPAR